MADQDDSFGDFFRSFTEGIKPGSKVMPLLRYRQGADLKDWSTAGSQKYVPGDWHMQCGCKKWSGAANDHGAVELTFPTPFAEPPVLVMTPTNTVPGFKEVNVMVTVQSAAVYEVYWFSVDNLTRVDFFWLALGPIGL